jgi:hypothetical protein
VKNLTITLQPVHGLDRRVRGHLRNLRPFHPAKNSNNDLKVRQKSGLKAQLFLVHHRGADIE